MVQIKCLSNGLYSLKNSHIPFGQGFQPPPPYGQRPFEQCFSCAGASLKLQHMDARCYTNKLQDYYIILSRDKGGTSSRHDWFSGLEAVGRPLLLCTEHYVLCAMQPSNHPSTPHNPNIKLQWDPRIDPMMRTCWLLKNSIFIGAS